MRFYEATSRVIINPLFTSNFRNIDLRLALFEPCPLPRPVYGSQTSDWLFKNWVDGVPPLGWHDTLCFLSLPLILIIIQSFSQKMLQPPADPVMFPVVCAPPI